MLKGMFADVLQKSLEAEMDEELGCSKYDYLKQGNRQIHARVKQEDFKDEQGGGSEVRWDSAFSKSCIWPLWAIPESGLAGAKTGIR